jgi:hypothetical protein
MDAAQLSEMVAAVGGLILILRFVIGTLDRAEAGFSALFVPPDRTMPWPRGVQESDAPWGWRPAAEPLETIDHDVDPRSIEPTARLLLPVSGHSRYVLPPIPVAPIRFRSLPQ